MIRIATAALVLAVTACSGVNRNPIGAVRPGQLTPAEQARADSGRPPWTDADVHFMQGMIVHHNQAVLIAGWAPSHGAGPAILRLSERIVVAQRDEIAIMATWLRDRRLSVPDSTAIQHTMPGMPDHPMPMPGMLTAEQLRRLDAARGVEFDRLFLTYMIQHHQGAVTMVDQLLGSTGAAQEVLLYKIASDVYADQTTEIVFMTNMLNALPPGGRP